MRPAHLSNAVDRLSQPTLERLSWAVQALAAPVTALAVGFVIGSAAIGPVLSDNSPDNAEALQARFERRSVDLNRDYPDPFVYRAATPDFGLQSAPTLGAYAKQKAQRELGGRGGPPGGLSAEAREAFGTPPQQTSPLYRTRDRHTGTSY